MIRHNEVMVFQDHVYDRSDLLTMDRSFFVSSIASSVSLGAISVLTDGVLCRGDYEERDEWNLRGRGEARGPYYTGISPELSEVALNKKQCVHIVLLKQGSHMLYF